MYTYVNMIRQIRGTVTDIADQLVVVDVGGVGYGVFTPHPTAQFPLETPVCFYTHLAVRENSQDLYGFLDRESLRVFELLIELPKIGPKSALQIMTQADVALIKEAVAGNDPSYLSKLSGIGKKSAEKIVAGLKDKFELTSMERSTISDYTSDTIDALIALGYSPEEARRAVLQLAETNQDIKTSPEALKAVLKILKI